MKQFCKIKKELVEQGIPVAIGGRYHRPFSTILECAWVGGEAAFHVLMDGSWQVAYPKDFELANL